MKKIIPVIFILMLMLAPWLIWSFKPVQTLDIAIIDKTVPTTEYREHLGFFQVLRDLKIVKPNGESYDIGNDYFGYNPYERAPFPPYHAENRHLDIIYITDTYGVYSKDVEGNKHGERSELIYGGMSISEWNAIVDSKLKDTILIAEFNSFASPTDPTVSAIMQENLGVHWTGWIGRFFQDLSNEEVPTWLIDAYESQYEKAWEFTGNGMAFVHENNDVIVFEDRSVPLFTLTENGETYFPDIDESNYRYWFDIVEPHKDTMVMATYQLALKKENEDLLTKHQLPTTIPAVIYDPNEKTYYFAGDYADIPKMSFSTWVGAHTLLKLFSDKESEFYWQSYVPMMKHILHTVLDKENVHDS